MTSLLAAASGPSGRVIAIEPHPALLDRLRSNITLWSGGSVTATVMVEAVALSSERGTGQLSIGDDFGRNAGIGSLEHGSTDEADCRTIDVRLERLDMLIADDVHIGVMKVDVEGHEEHLFEGASRLLEAGRVRDIVFEEHHSLPSPVSELLEGYGYTLFALEQRYLRPQLSPAHAGTSAASGSPSYVATKDPARALARFHRVGWKSLGH
jgi:FkbM family methyltransferase